MGSSENPNWIDSFLDDPFPAPNDMLLWNHQGLNLSSNVSAEIDSSFVNTDVPKEPSSGKRARSESSDVPASKACREKMRRDKLNDRFLELAALLDPGKPPRMDKAAILSDATRMVTQLRNEALKLKDSNESLQEKIKELKAEKNEIRDEKQRLKAEKESLEQQIKLLSARPSYVSHAPVMPAPFPPQGQAGGHKLMMPIFGYPGYPMWQYMPPADVDTTQDTDNCPPVA